MAQTEHTDTDRGVIFRAADMTDTITVEREYPDAEWSSITIQHRETPYECRMVLLSKADIKRLRKALKVRKP